MGEQVSWKEGIGEVFAGNDFESNGACKLHTPFIRQRRYNTVRSMFYDHDNKTISPGNRNP